MSRHGAYLDRLFGLEGNVAVVTGATGVLGGSMAIALARAGAAVGVLGRRRDRISALVHQIEDEGGTALGLAADTLQRPQLERALGDLLARWGRVDILVNAAGGNVAAATVAEDATFFDVPAEAFREVVDLNLVGSLLPAQVFGRAMTLPAAGEAEPRRVIVNVSSMSAMRPLTRVVGYSAAKAALENLTRWLAVELPRRHGAGLRVNAIAPGFFVGEQNRALLLDDDGQPTPRGRAILEHTPAARFGEADELVSTVLWLCAPSSSFINGAVVPVDGGFGAYAGV